MPLALYGRYALTAEDVGASLRVRRSAAAGAPHTLHVGADLRSEISESDLYAWPNDWISSSVFEATVCSVYERIGGDIRLVVGASCDSTPRSRQLQASNPRIAFAAPPPELSPVTLRLTTADASLAPLPWVGSCSESGLVHSISRVTSRDLR